MDIDKLADFIANMFEMPYSKEDIKERLDKNIPIPSVGDYTQIKNIVSHRFLSGLKHYMKICNVQIVQKGLNEQDCEVDISGGFKNLQIINILAKGYRGSEIKAQLSERKVE